MFLFLLGTFRERITRSYCDDSSGNFAFWRKIKLFPLVAESFHGPSSSVDPSSLPQLLHSVLAVHWVLTCTFLPTLASIEHPLLLFREMSTQTHIHVKIWSRLIDSYKVLFQIHDLQIVSFCELPSGLIMLNRKHFLTLLTCICFVLFFLCHVSSSRNTDPLSITQTYFSFLRRLCSSALIVRFPVHFEFILI